MKLATYEHIKKHIHLLNVDYVNGTVLNRSLYLDGAGRGYYRLSLANKDVRLHQVIAVLKYGEKCVGKEINHLNGDTRNNKPTNLEITDRKGNMKHAVQTGLQQVFYGEQTNNAKLTEQQVRDIKQRLANGEKGYPLSREYGVTADTIYKIRDGKTWQKVF